MHDQPRPPIHFPADLFFPPWINGCLRRLILTGLQVHTPNISLSQVEGLRSTCSQKGIQWNKLWYPERHFLLRLRPDLYLGRSGTRSSPRGRSTNSGVQTFKLIKSSNLVSSVWTSRENHDQLSTTCLATWHSFDIRYPCDFVSTKSYLMSCVSNAVLARMIWLLNLSSVGNPCFYYFII